MKSFLLSLVRGTAVLCFFTFLFFSHSSFADESAEAFLSKGLAYSQKGDHEQAIVRVLTAAVPEVGHQRARAEPEPVRHAERRGGQR